MDRGDIYDVDFGEPIGREAASIRPSVVVSSDTINHGSGNLIVVVPMTRTRYGLVSHVEVEAEGLTEVSYARCDQVRSVSTERLLRARGAIPAEYLYALDRALRFVLNL